MFSILETGLEPSITIQWALFLLKTESLNSIYFLGKSDGLSSFSSTHICIASEIQ